MDKIAVLIDFTPTCLKSIPFAVGIATTCQTKIALVHIAPSGSEENEKDFLSKMDVYMDMIPSSIEVVKHINYGSFYAIIPHTVNKLNIDFLIVGTHGKVGLKQNLLGSNILKLVKSLSIPSLVINDESNFTENTFENILFPIAPHEKFDSKLNQVTQIARPFNSTVYIIYIEKEPAYISSEITENLEKTKTFFQANNIKFEVIKEEAKEYSIGYSKQILKYMNRSSIGSICIMSKIAESNHYFGNVDKENILLNEMSTPVLCANEG